MNHPRGTVMALVAGGMAIGLACACRSNQMTGHEDVVLVRDGQPAATIVVADRPLWRDVGLDDELAGNGRINPRVFAEELQFWIERATGARLPMVVAAAAPATGTLIIFGESDLSRKFGFDCRNMPPEGFRITTFERGVALLGDVHPALARGGFFANRHDTHYPDPAPVADDVIDRGIGHATFEFLERFVGYRFYHGANRHDEESIAFGTITPKLTELVVPANTDWRRHPDFLYRLAVMGGDPNDSLAWYRCFRSGGSTDVHANHTHTSWHRIYGKTHPEIFAVNEKGVPYYQDPTVRPPFQSALNYAHPKTLELEIAHIEHYDRTRTLHNGWRAYATPNRLLATPADGKWYDYSPEAAPLSFPDGDMFLSQSDVYWDYIARLGRVAQERWPERMVVGSAYNRRMCPPTDRIGPLPDNVAVEMALCRSSAMTTQPVIREWLDAQIDRWHELLGRDRTRLGTWDYFCWPHGHYLAPVPHPHRLQAFLKRNHDKIAGQVVNPGGHPRIDHMMVVLWHKLLWDVDADVDALLAEHCRLFYGPAGPHVEALYQLTAKRYENTVWTEQLRLSAIPGEVLYQKIYPPEVIAQMKDLVEKAFAAVAAPGNELYRKRLDYIYRDADSEGLYQQDGWAAVFRTSANFHAPPASLAAERFAGKPAWDQAAAAQLSRGTHVCTAKPPAPDEATTIRFATDGEVLWMQAVCASPARAKTIFADGLALTFYQVPGAVNQPDADLDEHDLFMRDAAQDADLDALTISVDRNGKTNYQDVTATVHQDDQGWTVEVAVPYALLGITPRQARRVLFDVRRNITMAEFLPPKKRGQAWDGLPEDPPKRQKIEYGLALKDGFVWTKFNPRQRAAQVMLK